MKRFIYILGLGFFLNALSLEESVANQITLDEFREGTSFCYDRSLLPHTPVVDTHLHFRPFVGPAIPFREMVSQLKRSGVLFVNIYGIGQMLPVTCNSWSDCPRNAHVRPTLKNDFVNGANYIHYPDSDLHMTLSMTFPDLSNPQSILKGIRLLDEEYPNAFQWMGEVNLVKQALFRRGHREVPMETIRKWEPFMKILRERDIPLSIHSDLGNDEEPTKYLSMFEEMLSLYPDNKIVWMHMGLSMEQTEVDVEQHILIMSDLLKRYPQLMIDISWRILEDNYFSHREKRPLYVAFLNANSERILPGSDFVASARRTPESYQRELRVTSRINQYLDNTAFRNIVLGQNYFRLMNLDYVAPQVCKKDSDS